MATKNSVSTFCVVCNKSSATYKCPGCRSKYCSVVCCTEHKISCVRNKLKESNETTETIITNKGEDDTTIRNENEIILSEKQKANVVNSDKLKSLLKSKRLVADIESIDSAEDRLKMLRQYREKNSEFNIFCNQLIDIIKDDEKY